MSDAIEDRRLAFQLWGGIGTAWSEGCSMDEDICPHQAIEHEVVESVMGIDLDDDLGETEVRCAQRMAEFATIGGIIITALVNMLATAQAMQTGVAPNPDIIRTWVLDRLYRENMPGGTSNAAAELEILEVIMIDLSDPESLRDFLRKMTGGGEPDDGNEDPSD